jgi:AraC-like DNA-binding protein
MRASNASSHLFSGSWLAETDLVRVGRWSCNREAAPAWSSARVQSWPMVTFCHNGAFKVGSSRRADLIDRAACMVVAKDREYATLRLVHGTGSDVAVRPDVFAELLGTSGQPFPAGRALGVDDLSRSLSADAVLRESCLAAEVLRSASQPVDHLVLEESVMQLLASILDPTPSALPARSNGRVERARAYLAEYFCERVSLSQVAAAARTSSFHLCRLFRASVGMSLHRYQTRLRLFSAVRELVDPACSLADLALRLGFSHQSHLGQAFRREFGMTPTQARLSLASGRICRRVARETSFAARLGSNGVRLAPLS